MKTSEWPPSLQRPEVYECGVVLFPRNKVKELAEVNQRPEVSSVIERSPVAQKESEPYAAKTRWQTLFAVPLALAIALVVHWFAAKKEPPSETHLYAFFLSALLAAGVAAAPLQPVWPGLREWMRTSAPSSPSPFCS